MKPDATHAAKIRMAKRLIRNNYEFRKGRLIIMPKTYDGERAFSCALKDADNSFSGNILHSLLEIVVVCDLAAYITIKEGRPVLRIF